MKKKITFFFFSLVSIFCSNAQNATSYQLENGLTVILDPNQQDKHVYGSLVVNVGSVDEELNATGMAHYLEHMLFKGTTRLGTTDWEKEREHYEKTIALYDKLQNAQSEEEVKDINKQINEETIKQSKYIITNEFSAAIQQLGGKGLNASTNFERTDYYNAFPSNQIEKWLSIYSHRLENPVFRLFQTELETVYEEKNRSNDNLYIDYLYKVEEAIHGKQSPYARPVIGLTEHLKKPWLSAMISFFEKWYVPNNMALILSGKFNSEEVRPLIEKYFGKFEKKSLPERKGKVVQVPSKSIKEKVNLTPFLIGTKGFIIPKQTPLKETIAVELIGELLSNNFETGYLDKLRIEGDVINASAFFNESRVAKRLQIQYIPRFDINQFRQESLKFTEKMIMEALEKIKNEAYDQQYFDNIKTSVIQNIQRVLSRPSLRARLFTNYFVLGKDVNHLTQYLEELKSIDQSFVTKTANRFFTNNHITVNSEIGRHKNKEVIDKPKLEPVTFDATNHSSYYLDEWMKSKKSDHPFEQFDPKEISKTLFQDKVNLHYLKNEKNDLFRLIIRFGVGEHTFPKLKYATQLLNNSGVLNQYQSDELKKEFGNLNVSYSFSSDDNFTYILMEGYDQKLGEACQLLSRLMLIPEITEKALNGIIGRELNSRNVEEKSIASLQDALLENLIFGEKSDYIDRLSRSDLIALSPSELTGVFNDAIAYEADIFYYGQMDNDNLKSVLKQNLAFGANRKDKIARSRKTTRNYSQNTIYLVNEPKATQAHIYLFIESDPVDLNTIPQVDAFNLYFSGGFNGLMMKEIRENRALAYAAGSNLDIPINRKWNALMTGYIGTQADKTAETVSVLTDLLSNMPEYPNRIKGIKDYFINGSEVAFENKGSYMLASAVWKEMGYQGNPLDEKLQQYDQLTFDDIKKTYDKRIKGKKYAIGIVGKVSAMDIDQLKKYGKIVKVNKQKLFSKKN